MLTTGRCLATSDYCLSVERYYTLKEFDELPDGAASVGFGSMASGRWVRSSFHADLQSGLILNDAHPFQCVVLTI